MGGQVTRRSLVSVDLGKRVAGIAFFRDAVLVDARELRTTPGRMAALLLSQGIAFDPSARWAAEQMKHYAGKGGRRRDLEQLEDLAAALAKGARAAGGTYRGIPASRWIGGLPKAIAHARILGALTPEELDLFVDRTKESMDAVGIGLYTEGRTSRGVVLTKGGLS